ncbi:MAG: DUF1998 domain-containing protein [Acidobacteriota bacterium]
MIPPGVVPFLILLACLLIGVLADVLARGRRDGDSGQFWGDSLFLFGCVMGPALVYSALLPSLNQDWWLAGFHPHLDLVTGHGLAEDSAFRFALLIPLLLWTALLLINVFRAPGQPSRWLSGSAGLTNSRAWVLLFALPFLPLFLWGWGRLGGGEDAYPGALWVSQAILFVCLAAIALSKLATSPADGQVAAEEEPEQQAAPQLRAGWAETLRRHGIESRQLCSWPADPAPRAVHSESGPELLHRLPATAGIAPQLIEAVGELIERSSFGPEKDRVRLVLAPDDCGQIEVIAAAACILWQRFRESTLLVTASQAQQTAELLDRCLPDSAPAVQVQSGQDLKAGAALYVVDAETLSERLLPELGRSGLVYSVGWVVWYDVHRYTGVLAANAWAISRRLHRILHREGRLDLRILVLGRSSSYGDAQQERFLRRLFPYTFSAHSEVRIPAETRRSVTLHLLESQLGFASTETGRSLPQASRHPCLAAAWASVWEGWTTWLERPSGVSDAETKQLLQRTVQETEMGEWLRPSPSSSQASILDLEAGGVLSLLEKVCQGGRASSPGASHHVALRRLDNPYAQFLLESLSGKENGQRGFGTSRRLVGARAQPSIIRHHLLLALAEGEETGHGLRQDFLWEEDVITRTLDAIFQEGKLERREVRFLDQRGRAHRDRLYRNRMARAETRRPLDCVGTDLVVVREATAGHDWAGVRMLIDPERLPIQAYPGRIFLQGGRRYRVSSWESAQRVGSESWVECEQEGTPSSSLRIRSFQVDRLTDLRPLGSVGRSQRLLSLLTAQLHYHEDVTGVIRLDAAPEGGWGEPQVKSLGRPLSTSFPTEALLLSFSSRPGRLPLVSLGQALRTVLPVHLGVEEDALEVVPIHGTFAGETEIHGLAVVDLYPGGIGLARSIRDEDPLIRTILQQTQKWLTACDCSVSCPKCLATPLARATTSSRRPDRQSVLGILDEYLS